ncbi:MAG: hypothetical protein BWX55_00213 [Deltaproteobacteria bacterium ADurb.Bin022]|nr:MAG: hypothetical protein BWX55_00213 [Deltaproteobacteria bacterium ADurb.Bin022]
MRNDYLPTRDRGQSPGKRRSAGWLALKKDPVAEGPSSHDPIDIVVDDRILEPAEQIFDAESFVVRFSGSIGNENGTHLSEIRRTLCFLGQPCELCHIVYIVKNGLFFEERTGSGTACLVHVAFGNLTAGDLDELGILSSDFNDGETFPFLVIASDRSCCMGDNFVQNYNPLGKLREHRAENRCGGFTSGAGQGNSPYVRFRLPENLVQQTQRSINRIPASTVINVCQLVAGSNGR